MIFLFGSYAVAIDSVPYPRSCGEYFHSAAVFTGKVLSERAVEMEGDRDPGWIYRIRVLKAFKGPVKGVVEIYTSNTDIRVPLQVGTEYVLFVDDFHRGPFEIGTPTNSGPAYRRKKTIAAIERIRTAKGDGEITGQVFFDREIKRRPKVTIIATGKSSYSAVVDKHGLFRMIVVPGHYKLKASADGWSFRPPEFSYEDVDDISIVPGQCADVWFYSNRGNLARQVR